MPYKSCSQANHELSLTSIVFDTLRPRQNGRRWPDDIFKCNFMNEDIWISINISLIFVPKVPINNIPTLVQIMAWRHYLNQWWLFYWRIYASLGLDELNVTRINKTTPLLRGIIQWKNVIRSWQGFWYSDMLKAPQKQFLSGRLVCITQMYC